MIVALLLLTQNFEERQIAVIPDEYARAWADPVFTSDGKRAAYRVSKDGKQFVVVGKEKGEDFDSIDPAILFSRDGRRVAYVATRGGKKFVVVDKQTGEENEAVEHLQWAGDRPAYVALRGGDWVIVAGDKPCEVRARVTELVASPDGKRLAYATSAGGGMMAVLDETAGEVFDAVQHLVFSPDGKQFAYAARRAGRWSVMLDGKAVQGGGEFEEVGHPAISPDGQSIAFNGREQRFWSVFAFGKKGGPFDFVAGSNVYAPLMRGAPVWSPDSTQVAFAARLGKWYLVRRDRRQVFETEKQSGPYDMVQWPSFSADGQRLACAALVGGQWRVAVAGGPTGEGYARIGPPVWSRDGKRVGYGVVRQLDGGGAFKADLRWSVQRVP